MSLGCLVEGEAFRPLAGIESRLAVLVEDHLREVPLPGRPARLVILSESRLRRPTPRRVSMGWVRPPALPHSATGPTALSRHLTERSQGLSSLASHGCR